MYRAFRQHAGAGKCCMCVQAVHVHAQVSVRGQDIVYKDVIEPLESVSVSITKTDKEVISEFGTPAEARACPGSPAAGHGSCPARSVVMACAHAVFHVPSSLPLMLHPPRLCQPWRLERVYSMLSVQCVSSALGHRV